MRQGLGIVLIVAQQLCFTVETAAVHHLGGTLTVMQLALLRSVGGLLVVLCLIPTVGLSVLATRQPGVHGLRAIVSLGYQFVMMYSFTALPLADATAIGYTQAIYIVLFAPLILGEAVGAQRYWAVAIGLVGALCLINPSFSQTSLLYLGVLVGTSLNGLALVLTKYAQREDHPVTVMLYVNLAMTAFFSSSLLFEPLPGLAFDWSILWFLPVLIIGPLGMYLGIVAVRHADASVLAPYTYTRLLAIGVISPLLFHEQISLMTIIGAAIIVLACILSSTRSNWLSRLRATMAPTDPVSAVSRQPSLPAG